MSTSDPTEQARRDLIPDMPEQLREHLATGQPAWTTTTLQEQFEVLGFLAPFVMVRRKADGVRGSMTFTHEPRWYFSFVADDA